MLESKRPGVSMSMGRIHFAGNPWPEGHPIKEFIWTSRVSDGQLWFDFHLQAAAYDSERVVPDDPVADDIPDWNAAIVWTNYGACILSSNYWEQQPGIPVGAAKQLTLDEIHGMVLSIDDPPAEDRDAAAFHIYLLGHDSVACHEVSFERIPRSDCFNILWTGRIALTDHGDDEYRHAFTARIRNVPAPIGTLRSG